MSSSVSTGIEIHHVRVAAFGQVARFIQHVCDTARHAGRKIQTGLAEYDDAAASHVFATVITDALDDGERAAVADTKALGRTATEECGAACRAVQIHVTDDQVILCNEGAVLRRINDQPSAGQPLPT